MALVVFLKGVNVGGHRTFRPSLLAAQLDHLGVTSVGAAGTFIVRKAVGRAALRASILERLPFRATIMICDGSDVVELTSHDPFGGLSRRRDQVQFVAVRADSRRPRRTPPFALPSAGRWGVRVLGYHGRFVLGVHRREMRAIGHLAQLEEIVAGPMTTRSWTTIVRLARLLAE